MVILKPTEKELKFKKLLRTIAIEKMHKEYDHVNHLEFDIYSLSGKLDMSTDQVESLMKKEDWPMETGIRVCEALELDVTLDVEEYRY
jgi:glutamine synthetase type III